MPDIIQLLGHLESIGALAPNASPWPTRAPGDQVEQVDWDSLFPTNRSSFRSSGPVWGGAEDDEFPLFDPWDIPEDVVEDIVGDGGSHFEGPSDDGNAGGGDDPGWDRCAWYQPMHFFHRDWGIFIREECVRRLARQIRRRYHGHFRSRADLARACLRAATYVYFLHEQYHHKVECLGLRIEVATGSPAYVPYHRNVYRRFLGTDDLLEEALANADAYRRLMEDRYKRWITKGIVRSTREFLDDRFPRDPPGYRMAVDYLSSAQFHRGENRLQAQFAEASSAPVRPIDIWDFAPRMMQSMFSVESRIWVVLPPRAGRSIFPRLP